MAGGFHLFGAGGNSTLIRTSIPLPFNAAYPPNPSTGINGVLKSNEVSVFPNPSKGAINFTLNDFKAGNITVIFSDMNGKLIHREVIAATLNNSYRLNLKNTPAPGMYMLQVKGDGFEKSIQVVVQ